MDEQCRQREDRIVREGWGRPAPAFVGPPNLLSGGWRRTRYQVNERFFDEWNAPMAWALGLVLSSGHLSGAGAHICWESSDAEVVHKVRACLESSHPIHAAPGKLPGRPFHILQIARQRLRAGLDGQIVARRQVERSELPEVPGPLLSHLVRGYCDGRGSVGLQRAGGIPRVALTVSSALVESLRARLEAVGHEGVPYRRQPTQSVMLTFLRERAVRFAAFLYGDAPAALRLERKHAGYLQCLAWARGRGLEVPDVG
jgi:hypothetical protein